MPRYPCRIQHCKSIQLHKRFQSSLGQFTSNSQTKHEPILTELVYGRKRIYTSLQTIGKTKSATASKGRIAAPVTTSPMSWEWIQPAEDNNQKKKEWYQLKQNKNGFGALNAMKQNMREMFLPVGYPESVHDCYQKFHTWLFLETYVGSAIGVLCSQAMLASLGLGTVEATGGAVAIQWVLKDGIGEIGKLFFIKRYASSFDSHPKTWKFVCELFSTVGSFLQLCTSVVTPKLFLPLAAGKLFDRLLKHAPKKKTNCN
ncbi:vitamin B6 photo-protection and homoeostasis-domain-containing protein [Parasitella parasitica]|nr:vitamin B6 photo-protection and homoeostasis-domain-containing protein [Parasitella parasitica]